MKDAERMARIKAAFLVFFLALAAVGLAFAVREKNAREAGQAQIEYER